MPTVRLLDALADKRVLGPLPAEIRGIAYDSRKVAPGEIFVAIPGLKQDGRRYVEDALARGATAVVLEGADLLEGRSVGRVLVSSARAALARLADAYCGHPSGSLTVIGITGTNGKTTTSYLVDGLLAAQGRPTGLIGTVQYRIGALSIPAGQTTPEALETQQLLRRMVDEGVTGVAMEVSSHALALSRVEGIDFDVAVFTNLTQDHLDFHVTMDAYREAKRHLFALLAAGHKPTRTAVVNADDPSGLAMVADLPLHTLTYGVRGRADVRPTRWSSGAEGIRMNVRTPAGHLDIASPLVGEHNVENLLAATGVGVALGMEPAPDRARPGIRGLGAGTLRARRGGPAVSGGGRLRPHAGCSRANPGDRTQASRSVRTPRRRLRLRRRSRPRQAAAHGRHRGPPRRSRVGHLGQSAQRAAGGHHRRHRGGHPGAGSPSTGMRQFPTGKPPSSAR